ncbi:MAG: glycosyltransferase family 4 protein [archaeon]
MKILMFGWEFPPFNTGGLGTACLGLTRGLAANGARVTFVMPKGECRDTSDYSVVVPGDKRYIKIKKVDSLLRAYASPEQYTHEYHQVRAAGKMDMDKLYGKDLFSEVFRFAQYAPDIARSHDHDVIHAHDWMTYAAGINAKKASGKPLVVHVHATEFDRTGDNPNRYVYDAERHGMHAADLIIAVSNYTKDKIVTHYGIPEEKVKVVHNAVSHSSVINTNPKKKPFKVVLFLGRITIQKGPDYFLYAAHKVLSHFPDVRFVMAGSGDMESRLINEAARLGIGDKVLFTGFLSGKKLSEMYRLADLYVMPSVSEPFGIAPLEALKHGTPVLISKQSGVSEVLQNCLTTDFWDIDHMSAQIIAALSYPSLHNCLTTNGVHEVGNMRWSDSARRCIDVYNQAISSPGGL